MTQRNIVRQPLTTLQQAVVDLIWTRGRATAEQVRQSLRPAHPLKDSSVRTVLRRLEARGYLNHRVVGKTFVYRAELPPQRVAASLVKQIIDRFCAGSVEQFLVGMVDEQVLSLEQIEQLARQTKGGTGRRKQRKRG